MSTDKSTLHIQKHGDNHQNYSEEATGLRIKPTVIKFLKSYSGEPVKKKICFQNLTCKSIKISISKPYSFSFQLKDCGVISLGPGMCANRTIIFNNNDDSISSKLPIRVNDQKYLLPIIVSNIKPNLTIFPLVLDFGLLNIGEFSKRSITLKNTGECTTKFCIDFRSTELVMMADPKVGRSSPGTNTNVTIMAVGVEPGEFHNEFWVSSEPSTRILVSATVVVPCLKILHSNYNKNLTMIDFKSTYVNTCIYESFLVYNCSTDSSTFVVLAHHEHQFQPLNVIKNSCSSLDWFDIVPNEGKLLPFEAKNFYARFSPPRTNLSSKEMVNHFWTFIQVKKVDVTDDDSSNDESSKGFYKALSRDVTSKEETICFFGQSEEPDVLLEPDAFYCSLTIGECVSKNLKITNLCQTLGIEYEYIKIPHIDVVPPRHVIEPEGFVDVKVLFSAKNFTIHQSKLSFNLKYYSDMTAKTKTMTLKKKIIPLHITLMAGTKKPPQPVFNQGITPKNGGTAVGLNAGNVPFATDSRLVPRATIVNSTSIKQHSNKPWYHKSTIAFPNDRSSRFTVQEIDKNKRTIFTGLPRYVPPPDENMTYSPSEYKMKVKFLQGYKYFEYRKKRVTPDRTFEDYDVDEIPDERVYQMMKIKPLQPIEEKRKDVIILKDIAPLTPTQLYNIHISPDEIDFGNVPTRISSTSVIKVVNRNNFSIKVKFVHNSDLKLKHTTLCVGPYSISFNEISLFLKSRGLFYSNIVYLINGHYKFCRQVKANGVACSLTISPSCLVFKPRMIDFCLNRSVVNIYNIFPVKIAFEWKNYSDVPVEVYPECGCIHPKSAITCMVSLTPSLKRSQNMKIHLLIDGGRGEEIVSIVADCLSITQEVVLLNPTLILGDLPLGIPIQKSIFIFNQGFIRSKYSVMDTNPLDGITINPKSGEVEAKSIETITVSFDFDYLVEFNFKITINIENKYMLKLVVKGKVVFPQVEYEPKEINFYNIQQYTFSSAKIKIFNRSTAEVNLQFVMDNLIHFKVSTSTNYLDPGLDKKGIILKKGSSCLVYLHFEPGDIASYNFLLPVVINGIIGPPIMNNSNSTDTKYFIKEAVIRRNSLNKSLMIPASFDTVKVDCLIEGCEIKISNMVLNFFSLDIGETSIQHLTIQNMKCYPFSFSFELSPSCEHFDVKPLDVKKKPNYHLKPYGQMTFQISFKPKKHGSWYIPLPVYLYNRSAVLYNHIELNGLCYQPTLFCETNEVYMIPVPLNTKLERLIIINACYQRKDTTVTVDVIPDKDFNGAVTTEFLDACTVKKNCSPINLPVQIGFESKESISTRVKLIFKDGLGGSCTVNVYVTAKNSLLSTYIYHYFKNIGPQTDEGECEFNDKIPLLHSESGSSVHHSSSDGVFEENITTDAPRRFSATSEVTFLEELWFPEFPALNVESEYSVYMKNILRYTSTWAGFQGFNGMFKPNIGEEVVLTKNFNEVTMRASKVLAKNIIDLMMSLFGSAYLKKYSIVCIPFIEDDLERIKLYLSIYRNILNFLNAHGNGMAYLLPKYFLHYDDFMLFQANSSKVPEFVEESASPMSEKMFKRISKQMWLDLYLQVFKTHILDLALRSDDSSNDKYFLSCSSSKFQHQFETDINFVKLDYEADKIPSELLDEYQDQPYSQGEKYLLSWLTNTYKSAVGTLPSVPALTHPLDFGESLRDSYVLAVVASYYCGILMEEYRQLMYYKPVNDEQRKHNANNLVTALDRMHLGFSLIPQDLIIANPIFMIMFVSYLYFALPYYRPRFQLDLKAGLGSTVNQTISIHNVEDTLVRYYINIIQGPNQPFSMGKREHYYKIEPNQKLDVKVSYTANKVTKSSGMLLMSGSVLPGVQGVTVCVKMGGEPLKLVASNKYVIHLPLYKVVFYNLLVMCPYKSPCDYEIYVSQTEPSNCGDIFGRDLTKGCKLPLEIFLSSGSLSVNSKQKAEIPVALCRFYNETKKYWLLFTNEQIGDFIAKIILIPYTTEPRTVLTIGFHSAKEEDDNSGKIPAPNPLVNLLIPAKNSPMWNAAKTMMDLSLDSKNSLWTSKLSNPIGLTLLEFEVKSKCPSMIPFLNAFLKKSVLYHIEFTSPLIKLASSEIRIKDVHSDQFENIKVSVDRDAKESFTMFMTLTSEDKMEVRTYQVNFQVGKK